MEKKQLVLNTITMKEQLDQGISQVELLSLIYDLGIRTVEIRREFIRNSEQELKELKKRANSLGITLFYSVNDEVVKKNQVNQKLAQYVHELKIMGGKAIKFNVGNFSNFQGDLAKELAPLLDLSYSFTVENNQVLTHSNLQNIVKFFSSAKESALPITFVFDVANWYWLNENPLEAAGLLDDVTHYIHLKNYLIADNELVTVPLLEGEMDWADIVSHLHHVNYIGLEYPATIEEITTVKLLLSGNNFI